MAKIAEKNEFRYQLLLCVGSHKIDERDSNNSDIELKVKASNRYFLVFTQKFEEKIYLY